VSIELASKGREGHGIFWLAVLLLLHLTLLSLQIEDPSGAFLLKQWAMAASAPFISATTALSRGLQDAWSGYIWLHGARQENARLQETVQALSLEAQELERLRQENRRLQNLLDFKDGSSFRSIGARVVGRAPDFLSRVIYLDRGSADGVRVDCPVVTGNGIVGRVVLVTRHNAQVQLITNADASVGVMIERTGSPGVLRGSGAHFLQVGYIGSTEDVAVGDRVVTSGLDRVYPRGLPVGAVVESAKGKTVYRDIIVEPAVDLLRIHEGLILLRLGDSAEFEGLPRGEELNSIRN
jgi:rod shape-determining protein MreC